MESRDKAHWERVYQTKSPGQVSWTQTVPQISLDLIEGLNLPKTASIIDIGGGDSNLAGFLLGKGYTDVTVLDISEAALERGRAKLGIKSGLVRWIASDITSFRPERGYDIWHDRATFHFLTESAQIDAYRNTARVGAGMYMIIGTFAEDGPLKCSGLDVKRYSEQELEGRFADDFQKINCIRQQHITPLSSSQSFIFCSFSRNWIP